MPAEKLPSDLFKSKFGLFNVFSSCLKLYNNSCPFNNNHTLFNDFFSFLKLCKCWIISVC